MSKLGVKPVRFETLDDTKALQDIAREFDSQSAYSLLP